MFVVCGILNLSLLKFPGFGGFPAAGFSFLYFYFYKGFVYLEVSLHIAFYSKGL